MRHGVETEMGACPLHEARPATRLAPLVARLSETPVSRLPRACQGWAETVAASRGLDTPAMGEEARLAGHTHAMLARIRAQAVVVWGEDPTCWERNAQELGVFTLFEAAREVGVAAFQVAGVAELRTCLRELGFLDAPKGS